MKIRVTIVPHSGEARTELTLELSGEQLYDKLVRPYEEGNAVQIAGRTFHPDEVDRITISAARSPSRWRAHPRRKKAESEKREGGVELRVMRDEL